MSTTVLLAARAAGAHHEALFGPQSSLAVESEAFVSLQGHEHVTGVGASATQESTYILSAGITPFRAVPWSVTLVQAYTFQTTQRTSGIGARCGFALGRWASAAIGQVKARVSRWLAYCSNVRGMESSSVRGSTGLLKSRGTA